jgi:hypothetical protein
LKKVCPIGLRWSPATPIARNTMRNPRPSVTP